MSEDQVQSLLEVALIQENVKTAEYLSKRKHGFNNEKLEFV